MKKNNVKPRTWLDDVGRPRLKAVLGKDYDYLMKQCSRFEYEEALKNWPIIVITRRNKKTGKTEQHTYNVSEIAEQKRGKEHGKQ